MDTLAQDIRYAVRRLIKSPGFSIVAILTLALGIGANTAIFSVVNAVLLRALPYSEPDRLVQLFNSRGNNPRFPVSAPNYLDFREQKQLFTGVAAFDDTRGYNLVGIGDPARLTGAAVSAEFFDVLGTQPTLGRGFRAEENEPGAGGVVVLSNGIWQQYFGSDPSVIGRNISLSGVVHTVVGVMPAGFDFPRQSALWTPLEYDAQFRDDSNRGSHYLGVVARLRPGVSAERAAAEMRGLGDRLATEFPQLANSSATAVPMREVIVGSIRPALLILLGAVGLVLLIACANVANLLLARAAAREGELAVRAALGAGRRRLMRQLLTESMILALAGGLVGLLLAFWGTEALGAIQPRGIQQLGEVRVDTTVVAFTASVALLTGILFGLVPALQVTRSDLAGSIREGARGALSGRSGKRLRNGLVVAEMALAVMLLAGAGLLIRSFVGLTSVDPGFQPQGVLSVELSLPGGSYPDAESARQFYSRLHERLTGLPGVTSAGAVSTLPLGGRGSMAGFFPADGEAPRPGEMPVAHIIQATPDYFRALGVPLRRGRLFTPADRAGAPVALLLSESGARRIFRGEEALGRSVALTFGTEEYPNGITGTVVGIVGNVHQKALDSAVEPEVYIPFDQAPFGSMEVVLRTTVEPLSLAASVRAAVQEIDPELPVGKIRTVEQVVAASVAQPRFYMTLLTLFAGVALALSAVGIFGVISYSVTQRTREIGMRMALGADARSVMRSVVGGGMRLVLLGLGIGLIVTFGLARLISGMLYGIAPSDPVTLGGVVVVLGAVAFLACWLPARRATRIDPVVALRAE
jgi:putative ABC transport system permease protein